MSFYPPWERPPDQVFKWVRIEHVDGRILDWNHLWFDELQLAGMEPRDAGYEEYLVDVNRFFWAAGIHERRIEGVPGVRRVIAEWVGPMGSGPPLDELETVAIA